MKRSYPSVFVEVYVEGDFRGMRRYLVVKKKLNIEEIRGENRKKGEDIQQVMADSDAAAYCCSPAAGGIHIGQASKPAAE